MAAEDAEDDGVAESESAIGGEANVAVDDGGVAGFGGGGASVTAAPATVAAALAAATALLPGR